MSDNFNKHNYIIYIQKYKSMLNIVKMLETLDKTIFRKYNGIWTTKTNIILFNKQSV